MSPGMHQYLSKAKHGFVRLLAQCGLTKPTLRYVEFDLVDHCNMNCSGCGHFSPIAEPWFVDPSEYERDMRQIRKLFQGILKIRLMGGEALLHKEVERFIRSTRELWPASDVRLVTNGLLLRKMPESFWSTCRDNRICLDWTVYPPLLGQKEALAEFVKKKGVSLDARVCTEFFAHKNFQGDSDPEEAFRACRARFYCPFLRSGKLYICAAPYAARHIAKRFGTLIPSDGFVDIYAEGMTGMRALRLLNRPGAVCRFCSTDFRSFPWVHSQGDRSEWDVLASPEPATEL